MKIARGNVFSIRSHPIQIMFLLIIFSLLLFPIHFLGTVSSTGKTNLSVVASVLVESPQSIAYDAANGDLYVVSPGLQNSVYVIDGVTNTVITAVSAGIYPTSIAFDPANGYLYVTDFGSRDVAVINGNGNSLVGYISVGQGPDGIVLDSSTGDLYVGYASSNSKNVTVIYGNTNQVTGNISLGPFTDYLAFNQKNGYVYVAYPGGNVSVIDGFTKTIVTNITAQGGLGGPMVYDPSNENLYIADHSGTTGNISVINSTNAVIQTNIATPFNKGGEIYNLAYNSLNGDLYWVGFLPGGRPYLYAVSPPANIIANVSGGPAGDHPFGEAFDPSNGYLYVSETDTNTVVAIANTSVATTSTPIASTITMTSILAPTATITTTAKITTSATITTTATSTLTATTGNGGNYLVEAVATIVAILAVGSLALFYFLRFRRT